MHLIDLAKSGQPVPVTLPHALIPSTKRFNEAEPLVPEVGLETGRPRSESVSSLGKVDPGRLLFFFCFFLGGISSVPDVCCL